jgi:hypothetical protein
VAEGDHGVTSVEVISVANAKGDCDVELGLGRQNGDTLVAVGDEVVLFGDPARGVPSVAEWARACDTNVYEIVTRMGGRLDRVVVE